MSSYVVLETHLLIKIVLGPATLNDQQKGGGSDDPESGRVIGLVGA